MSLHNDLLYIRGIVKNRCGYFSENMAALALLWLTDAYNNGCDTRFLKDVALEVKSWTDFRNMMSNYVEIDDGVGNII